MTDDGERDLPSFIIHLPFLGLSFRGDRSLAP
jgi:hypothetical protein